MSLSGCQINPIDVNFHFQKRLDIFGKNSADKVWSKKDRGRKVPCLMSIRVKGTKYVYFELNNKLSFKIGARPCLEISPYILHVSFQLRDKKNYWFWPLKQNILNYSPIQIVYLLHPPFSRTKWVESEKCIKKQNLISNYICWIILLVFFVSSWIFYIIFWLLQVNRDGKSGYAG